jgi:hypothetical protein
MTQSAWLGPVKADVDSATRYDDPQDGQTQSDIFIGSACVVFDGTPTVPEQCGITKDGSVSSTEFFDTEISIPLVDQMPISIRPACRYMVAASKRDSKS